MDGKENEDQLIDGRNVGRVLSFRDITERGRAEEELRKRSEWLRITLSSIGDGVIATDVEGRVTFMNGVAESLTGWTQAAAVGRPLNEVFLIVHEQTRESVENPALRALREGSVVGLANHTVLIARDGSERPIDDSAATMRSETGATVGAVLVFRDVTQRKRAEKDLARVTAESERRRRLYETVLSSTPDLVYVFGLDHRFTYANEALLKMWGQDLGRGDREDTSSNWVTSRGTPRCTTERSTRSSPRRSRSGARFPLPGPTADGSTITSSCR